MKRDVKDTHVYFPIKLLAELKRMAAANRRTVSAEIVMAVEARVGGWLSEQIASPGFVRDVQPINLTVKRERTEGGKKR